MTAPADPALSPEELALLHQAEEVSHNAYAAYSGFTVGAIVTTASGNSYKGCNVENMAYPIGSCAERNALAAAVAAEGPTVRITQVAIAARNHDAPAPCSPCGSCRQAIAELAAGAQILFRGPGLQPVRTTAAALLPMGFAFTPQRPNA